VAMDKGKAADYLPDLMVEMHKATGIKMDEIVEKSSQGVGAYFSLAWASRLMNWCEIREISRSKACRVFESVVF